jgi:hypothetical protein
MVIKLPYITLYILNYRTLCQRAQSRDLSKASLWAENCPNFLAGTSPKGPRKTTARESFLRENKLKKQLMSCYFFLIYRRNVAHMHQKLIEDMCPNLFLIYDNQSNKRCYNEAYRFDFHSGQLW